MDSPTKVLYGFRFDSDKAYKMICPAHCWSILSARLQNNAFKQIGAAAIRIAKFIALTVFLVETYPIQWTQELDVSA